MCLQQEHESQVITYNTVLEYSSVGTFEPAAEVGNVQHCLNVRPLKLKREYCLSVNCPDWILGTRSRTEKYGSIGSAGVGHLSVTRSK